MPARDSFSYTIPTSTQRDSFAIIIDQILATNYATAATLADEIGYDLVIWDDTGNSSQRYYVLKEDSSQHVSKSSWKGWGTYIFRDNGSTKAAVQVPHPLNDTNTWRVGFESYRANNSRFFMMAGTHRYANSSGVDVADVAHDTLNMFYLVHKKISPLSTKAVQIHGFKQSNYVTPLPDVIISNGTSLGSTDALAMKLAIDSIGFDAGVYDNNIIPHLGATQNVEGDWSLLTLNSFVHVEIDSFIRFNSVNRAQIILGITAGLDIDDISLPVYLRGKLNVEMLSNGFRISAQTASEADVSEIQLQRKAIDQDGTGEWKTIRRFPSNNVYTSGRMLDHTYDYPPMHSIAKITYRLISIENDGQILTDIKNAHWEYSFEINEIKTNVQATLLQSSPNPFKMATTIGIVVEQPAKYSLIIYDILGRKIRQLISNQHLTADHLNISWDGRNNAQQRVASGIYFYQLINHNTGQMSIRKLQFIN
jgi:hypothetical protein